MIGSLEGGGLGERRGGEGLRVRELVRGAWCHLGARPGRHGRGGDGDLERLGTNEWELSKSRFAGGVRREEVER